MVLTANCARCQKNTGLSGNPRHHRKAFTDSGIKDGIFNLEVGPFLIFLTTCRMARWANRRAFPEVRLKMPCFPMDLGQIPMPPSLRMTSRHLLCLAMGAEKMGSASGGRVSTGPANPLLEDIQPLIQGASTPSDVRTRTEKRFAVGWLARPPATLHCPLRMTGATAEKRLWPSCARRLNGPNS